ncbi:MAG: N-acetylglucosamine-6-phosphate deacetylase [Erysipelotrichaceae bacterium]|nr:N-acetylglucosamine-6-phosphate deacetylase [Erysipelotrichaceae bacterium]
MQEYLIISKRILTPNGFLAGALHIQNGIIVNIYQEEDELPDLPMYGYRSQMVLPGIIDLHTHGLLGWAAASFDAEKIEKLAQAECCVGVTAFQPSIADLETMEDYDRCLHAIGKANPISGARILGAHMEGPYFHPDHKGCDLARNITPSLDAMKAAIEASDHHLTYVALAPELQNMDTIIPYLLKAQIRVGIGHSDATFAQAWQAIEMGANIGIHTGNAMREIHQREIGISGALLLHPDAYCELICDFHHLAPEYIQLVLKMKGKERVLMMSDATEMSGLSEGIYRIRGRKMIVKEGKVQLEDGTIAGSSSYVLAGMKNLVQKLNLPIEDVSYMASMSPANVMGIQAHKGSLEVGKDADIMVLDDDFNCMVTYVEGTCRYQGEPLSDYTNHTFFNQA